MAKAKQQRITLDDGVPPPPAEHKEAKIQIAGLFANDNFTPERALPPIAGVSNDDLSDVDMLTLLSAYIDGTGLVGHIIKPFNRLLEYGLKQIVTQSFMIDRFIRNDRKQTPLDQKHKNTRLQVEFQDLTVGWPVQNTHPAGLTADLYPCKARLSAMPYSAPITIAARVELTAYFEDGSSKTASASIPPFQVTKYPIMVGSARCHTTNMSREALKNIGEDPTDQGGHFVAKSQEWTVDLLENIKFNSLHVHLAMVQNELARGEFISQPGGPFENSSQVIVRHMSSGALTIEMNSMKFARVRIPFYLIYRIFGMTSDRDIVATIVTDEGAPTAAQMLQRLETALQHSSGADPFSALKDELNRETIVREMARLLAQYLTNNTVGATTNEDAIRYLNSDLLSILDKIFLPHMGLTSEARRPKMRFLGQMIYKVFLVELRVLPPTDRDSYKNKRVHGPGVSLAKAFKTQFNANVIGPLQRAFRRELRNNPFDALTPAYIATTFRNSLAMADFVRAMEQSLTSGNKPMIVQRRVAPNRVSSQVLERKNGLNLYSSLRTVTTHNSSKASKQTERADMMRRVHPTYTGFICISQSADTGENVGMRKQLACSASVCDAGEPELLKARLLADTVIPLARVENARIVAERLSRVLVNGELIGYCRDAHALVRRYRDLRREQRVVDSHTSIVWDPVLDEVEFSLDLGRLVRPLLIVYNNLAEYDAARRARWAKKRGAANAASAASGEPEDEKEQLPQFCQNVRLAREHIDKIKAGALTLDDMFKEGLLEFITPEEQENCLIATSIDVLRECRHDVTRRYTHCDVPQAIWGLAALVTPYGHCTQTARVTYETNQGRQTCGWYVLNFPYRMDKNRFWQIYNQVPLVRTLVHKYVLPNGTNMVTALMPYGGDNMEDSAIVNRASVDRGLVGGAFYRTEKVELDRGETFCTPDPITTRNMKPNASYAKLVDGFAPVGTTVARGDVLIGRVAKISRDRETAGAYKFEDRSIVYRHEEPAVVDAVLRPRGANDELFGLVRLIYQRPLKVGDKLSTRSGNKSIAAVLLPQADMPFTDDGLTPDLLMNTSCLPSRMIIGQLIETSLAKVCARRGVITDGTAGLKVSIDEIESTLVAEGFRFNGRERMYNGMTGSYFDVAIFVGPTYEQRLQKFVLDDERCVSSNGPTDATTGQPLSGKNVKGGLRVGEMEAWCLQSHGSMMNQFEKFSTDSDGRTLYVCRPCGNMATHNARAGIYSCRYCGEAADIAAVDSSRSSIVFQHELAAANARLRLGLRPREFEERAGGAAPPT